MANSEWDNATPIKTSQSDWDSATPFTDKSDLSRSAIISHNVDSDKYAQNRKAMTDKGIPAAFALPANKPPSMDGMLSTIKDFLGLSGKTAEHMSDPDFAKVAKDDHPVLTRLEDMVTGFPKRLYGAVEAGESIVSGIGGAIGGAATGLTTLALTKGDTEAAKAVQEGVSNVLTYHPMTEVGKEYTEMAEKIAAIPSYVGHELSEEVAQQWNAPEWLRYIFNTAGDFGGYALADVAVRGAGAHIKNVVDTAKESKLKARDPEQFKAFVKDVAGDSTVQAPLAVVDDILTKAKTTPEEALSDPTAYYEQKFEGMASDTPVKADIPIQDVATLSDHITPEHIKDMSVEGIPSQNEAEKHAVEYRSNLEANPEDVNAAIDKVKKLADSIGIKINNIDIIDKEKRMDWNNPSHRDALAQHGIGEKEYNDAIANGEKFLVSAEHEIVNQEGGQKGSNIRLFRGHSADDVYHEFSHAIDEQGGLPGWTGTKEERAKYVAQLFKDGKESNIKELTPEALKADEQAKTQAEGDNAVAGANSKDAEEKKANTGDMFAAGPGAKTEGVKGELPSDIEQLSSALPKGKSQSGALKNAVTDAMQTIKGIKDSTVNAFTAMKDVGQKIWDSYRKPPEWTEFKEMLGDYQLSREKSGIEASKFVKKIQDSIPKDVQEKITMWIDSGGKTELPAEYKTLAENVRNYFASRADQTIEAGVIDHAVENYVHRIWGRNSKIGKQTTAETNAGMFQQNPKLAKQRVLSSISEGESLGLKMKDKRIGYLLTAYDSSLNEAIAARGFVKSLLNGKAKDGRALGDVSGSGKQVLKEGVPDSIIIKPKTKPEESVDYKPINHPSMRKWKWAGQDAEGKPIIMQGDLVVHPEIYKHMKNILGESAIREFEVAGRRPGEALLNGIQELKGTLLSLSGFHQVQEGVHAVGHEVNPFNVKEIDLNDPLQADLVKHGVMVYSHNAMQDFSEGVYASGLVTKIPVIGRQMQAYGEYLFQGYIPRLKMEMARQAYERNTKRYKGKLNDDQIKELTAKEANAAFGEQNYVMMGRNKTMQDMFRLVALAPDFLESRAKFVGQALKPYGREQMAALLRLSAYMAVAAQVTNYFVNGETDWSQPFSAKIDGKYYTLRSVPGDLIHLVTDPRSFSYHRLNPSTTKPLVEGLTGRNVFGQKQDIFSQMGDWIKGFTPIPLQGLVMDKNDMTLLDSILQSTGVGSRKAKTPAETKISELLGDRIPGGQTQEQKKQSFTRRQIVDAFRKNKPLNKDQRDAYSKMTEKQQKNIEKESEMLPIQVAFSHLTPDEAKVVWNKMSNKEKLQVGEIYEKKIENEANKE